MRVHFKHGAIYRDGRRKVKARDKRAGDDNADALFAFVAPAMTAGVSDRMWMLEELVEQTSK
jgi:hypothetical protein